MELNNGPNKREKIYNKHLREISGVKFTTREIDIISCIIHSRKEKKIAMLLSISPKTVNAHVYNVMSKLGYNNRDLIIDFVEKSGKLLHLRQYYFCIISQYLFEQQLQKIGKTINRNSISCELVYKNAPEKEDPVLKLEHYLKLANIQVSINTAKNNDHSLCRLIVDSESLGSSDDIGSNNQIILFFEDTHVNSDRNIKYVDFSPGNNFYEAILLLIEMMLNSDEITKIRQDFQEEHKGLRKSLHSDDNDALPKLTKNKPGRARIIIISISALLFSVVAVSFFTNPFYLKTKPNLEEINQDFAKFVEIISSDNISTDTQRRQNHNSIQKIENTVQFFEEPEVQEYFLKIDLPRKELINCLYVLHALSNQYTYNNHNGIKARKLLNYAKNFAEQYVKNNYSIRADFAKFTKQIRNSNTTEIDFNQLTKEQLLAELSSVQDLAEMYTRIIYLIGRTYVYQGDLSQSVKYFQLAQYLGDKLGIFEGYLSTRSGLDFIEETKIAEDLGANDTESAKAKILGSIELNKQLLNDDRKYKINYKPENFHPEIIVPKDDPFNYIYCAETLTKHFARLIFLSSEEYSRLEYLKEIEDVYMGAKSHIGLIDFCNQVGHNKSTASVYNNLGNILLKLHTKNINYKNLNDRLVKTLKLASTEELEVIKALFNLALAMEIFDGGYIQADSYDGLIRLNLQKLTQSGISVSCRQQLKKEIAEYEVLRDKINSNLNRNSWRLNKYKLE
jgi:DNA-binding CsgD family transcriptional regulator